MTTSCAQLNQLNANSANQVMQMCKNNSLRRVLDFRDEKGGIKYPHFQDLSLVMAELMKNGRSIDESYYKALELANLKTKRKPKTPYEIDTDQKIAEFQCLKENSHKLGYDFGNESFFQLAISKKILALRQLAEGKITKEEFDVKDKEIILEAQNTMSNNPYKKQSTYISQPLPYEYSTINQNNPAQGTPVYKASDCIGANVMGICHGSVIGQPSAVCHGTMLNGECIGALIPR